MDIMDVLLARDPLLYKYGHVNYPRGKKERARYWPRCLRRSRFRFSRKGERDRDIESTLRIARRDRVSSGREREKRPCEIQSESEKYRFESLDAAARERKREAVREVL